MLIQGCTSDTLTIFVEEDSQSLERGSQDPLLQTVLPVPLAAVTNTWQMMTSLHYYPSYLASWQQIQPLHA